MAAGPLEKNNQNALYASEDDCPYRVVGRLGEDGKWINDVASHKTRRKEYVRIQHWVRRDKGHKRRNEELEAMASLLRELRHKHIVSVVETFECAGRLNLLIDPVPDTSFQQLIRCFDLPDGNAAPKPTFDNFLEWIPCITKALNYLHSQNIEHGNIKPSTIWLRNNRIILAGFGSASRFNALDPTNTGTMDPASRQPISKYLAPTGPPHAPRPRLPGAADVFSLGCIFLEIATVICDRPGSLSRLRAARAAPGSTSTATYAQCPQQLVQWLSTLSTMRPAAAASSSHGFGTVEAADWTRVLVDLAFRALDPDPASRPAALALAVTLQWFGLDVGGCSCEGEFQLPAEHCDVTPQYGESISGWAKPWHPMLYNLEAAERHGDRDDDDVMPDPSPWETAKLRGAQGVKENAVVQGILRRAAERRSGAVQVGGPPHTSFMDVGTSLPDPTRLSAAVLDGSPLEPIGAGGVKL